MPRIIKNENTGAEQHRLRDGGVPAFLSQMTCACAENAAHIDAPIAWALFQRVDVLNQPCRLAARELGLGLGDATYLLAGLRADVAQELVLALGAGRAHRTSCFEKDFNHD